MSGSWDVDEEYFLELTFRACFGFPFVDVKLGIGYNRRSPAVCQASWERRWIVENRNSADYMELGRTVKVRRRQTSIQLSFYDVKTRPYSLRANLLLLGWQPLKDSCRSIKTHYLFNKGEMKYARIDVFPVRRTWILESLHRHVFDLKFNL